ncbi:MAG TPA: alanine racemase [Thermomicrobiales bacterium]|nr:alanine racemase [Thermomicrobiales bacterium]
MTALAPAPVGELTPTGIASQWQGRGAVVVVDLDAYAGNIRAIRGLVNPEAQLLAVVKANAYGHGANPLAKVAMESGAGALGVATVDEGAQLRSAGIDAPILVFGAIGRNERARAIGLGLELVVADIAFARGLAAEAKASLRKEPVPVHIKIDSGMNRFGVNPDEAVAAAREITAHPELRLVGLMTHQASADAESDGPALRQEAAFDAAIAAIADAGIELPMQHMANSATLLRFPEMHRGQVRAGILSFGLNPDPALPAPALIRPVATIHARLMRVFEIERGEAVGYGGTYRSTRREKVGLVPLGYADGYRRDFSNRGWMSVQGQRAEIIGRVSMDQCVVRLSEGAEACAGDPVVVVGDGTADSAGAPTFNELASLIGTIPYELCCGLAPRLPRLYLREGRLVGIADLFGYRELT